MFPAKDNAELKSVLVPRLFVEFAMARGIADSVIVRVHDALHEGKIRHDAINTSPDGAAQMAVFLCDYVMGKVMRELPLWFANGGGVEALR